MLRFLALVLAVLIVVVIAVVAPRVWRRRVARLKALAPGEFVFFFDSNRWFQNGVVELRTRGLVDEKLKTDSEDPTRGPHWASASTQRLTFRRGYTTAPYFSLAWSQISTVDFAIESPMGAYSRSRDSRPGVRVEVAASGAPITLLLTPPTTGGSIARPTADAKFIVDELNRLRGVTPSP